MHYAQELKPGHVYYLKDYTAPKLFNGLYFVCLLTDQKIAANAAIKKDLGEITKYDGEIWKPERLHQPKSFRNMTTDEARIYMTNKYSF